MKDTKIIIYCFPQHRVPLGFIRRVVTPDSEIMMRLRHDGFKWKVRLVAGGHMTDAPPVMTYVSVVSHDTV